jgi:hypothetical protein
VTEQPDDDVERELELLIERSGIAVPVDLRPGVLAGCRDLRRMADLLRQPRPAENEPAQVYRVSTIRRAP